jgi:hypothetical protein
VYYLKTESDLIQLEITRQQRDAIHQFVALAAQQSNFPIVTDPQLLAQRQTLKINPPWRNGSWYMIAAIGIFSIALPIYYFLYQFPGPSLPHTGTIATFEKSSDGKEIYITLQGHSTRYNYFSSDDFYPYQAPTLRQGTSVTIYADRDHITAMQIPDPTGFIYTWQYADLPAYQRFMLAGTGMFAIGGVWMIFFAGSQLLGKSFEPLILAPISPKNVTSAQFKQPFDE